MYQGLHPFRNYTLQIAAVTVEVGPYSEPITATTLEDCKFCVTTGIKDLILISTLHSDPTGPPLSVNVICHTAESIKITWKPPELLRQNGLITSYVLHTNSSAEKAIYSSTKQATIIVGLFPYTTYYVSVSAANSVGEGPFAEPVIITTLEDGNFLYMSIQN